ncbi:hypothetical protein M407DRAFT_29538 [Tulasnella calospora MUT 4182]|uniref:F-box domain-containing protein n=1 Tax=Tulasnella calospora MUT 4182 TaxID=1051891 RepID=A0A0C3LHE2_9AGAM|nr:hypothetical protein M407DRAFT_29538 [Tulasnella calospora MUT 4182]
METTSRELETPSCQNKQSFHILELPYDLVHVVFLLCWDQEDERLRHFPVVASHVCRLWRQYALENPNFWTSLTFETRLPEIDKYSTWLSRSKDVRFDLTIGSQPFEGASIKHAKNIMRLIIPHVQRMRSIRVKRVPPKIRQLIFDRLDEVNCPSLVTLLIEKESYIFATLAQSRWKFRPFAKGGAPQLKEIILRRIPNDYFIHQFGDLHLLEIQDRDLFGRSARDNAETVQRILSVLSKLQTLRINREFLPIGDGIPELTDMRAFQSTLPPITHHSLEELSVIATQHDTNAIICSTILPSLRHLRRDIGSGLPVGACCLPILAHQVPHHPFPNLLSLRLSGGHNPERPVDPVHSSHMAFLRGALAGLPHLEFLNLEQVDFDSNKHVTCLARSCPRLKEIVLFCCSGFTLMELCSVIRRRGEASDLDPLRYVCVEDPWSYRIRRLIEQAEEQGSEIISEFNTGISKTMADRIVLVDNK